MPCALLPGEHIQTVRATTFVWCAAGSPPPIETDGTRIIPRARAARPCAHCGDPAGRFLLDQAISDKFTTVRNASVLWPFGGAQLCAGCTWVFKSLLVRSGLMFARLADAQGGGGLFHVPTRPWPRWPSVAKDAFWPGARVSSRALDAILSPPPVPFVAWFPLYGVDHGGEMHIHRTFGPDGSGGVFRPHDPLWKLQTKHTLPFAAIATDARRYELAVNDWPITVDVVLWRDVRELCDALLAELRAMGVGAEDARRSLLALEAPPRSLFAPRVWRERVAPLRPHAAARWFEVFVSLLHVPALKGTP